MGKKKVVVGDVGAINFGDKDTDGDFVVENTDVEEMVATDEDGEHLQSESNPTIGSYEWSPYVIEQLKEDEMFDGNPTVDGLRRLVCLLLGTIIREASIIKQCPTMDNEYRATVCCTIEVMTLGGYGPVCVDGAADVYPGNTDKEFAKFPVATAETRAAGRAFRKLLQLRKVVTAEEVCVSNDEDENKKITNSQINFIDKLCNANRLDINIKLFINGGSQQYEKITDIAHETGVRIITRLNELQRDKDSIPDNIKNYDPEWRKDFS